LSLVVQTEDFESAPGGLEFRCFVRAKDAIAVTSAPAPADGLCSTYQSRVITVFSIPASGREEDA